MRLFDQVALEIVGERRGDLIARRELASPLERSLHQFEHRARDVIPRREIRRVDARVVEQASGREHEARPGELDLLPQSCAGRQSGTTMPMKPASPRPTDWFASSNRALIEISASTS